MTGGEREGRAFTCIQRPHVPPQSLVHCITAFRQTHAATATAGAVLFINCWQARGASHTAPVISSTEPALAPGSYSGLSGKTEYMTTIQLSPAPFAHHRPACMLSISIPAVQSGGRGSRTHVLSLPHPVMQGIFNLSDFGWVKNIRVGSQICPIKDLNKFDIFIDFQKFIRKVNIKKHYSRVTPHTG